MLGYPRFSRYLTNKSFGGWAAFLFFAPRHERQRPRGDLPGEPERQQLRRDDIARDASALAEVGGAAAPAPRCGEVAQRINLGLPFW